MIRMVAVVGILVGCYVFPLSVAMAGDGCLERAVSATGKASRIGELARANSFFTWKAVVKGKHGTDYMAWSEATERKLVCVDLMSGENKGKWECTRTAKPCRSQLIFRNTARQCKDTVLSAWGARRYDKAQARAQAISGWEISAAQKLGAKWAFWDFATKKSFDCKKRRGRGVQCVAEAFACVNPVQVFE